MIRNLIAEIYDEAHYVKEVQCLSNWREHAFISTTGQV